MSKLGNRILAYLSCILRGQPYLSPFNIPEVLVSDIAAQVCDIYSYNSSLTIHTWVLYRKSFIHCPKLLSDRCLTLWSEQKLMGSNKVTNFATYNYCTFYYLPAYKRYLRNYIYTVELYNTLFSEFPYIRTLLNFDVGSFFNVMTIVFDDPSYSKADGYHFRFVYHRFSDFWIRDYYTYMYTLDLSEPREDRN